MKYFKYMMHPFAGLFLILLLFTACKKDSFYNDPNPPVAGLMAVNLAPDQSAARFTIGGSNFGYTAYSYGNFTGSYLPVYTGSREVRSFDNNTGSTLAYTNNNFADSGYYSSFLVGYNGKYRNLVVEDRFAPLVATAGKAWVRYINAIPDSVSVPVVNFSSNDVNVISEPVAYTVVSAFIPVDAGEIKVAISNTNNITANRSIMIEENKIYTILLVGIPGQSDPLKAVQIKFIENGKVSP